MSDQRRNTDKVVLFVAIEINTSVYYLRDILLLQRTLVNFCVLRLIEFFKPWVYDTHISR
jgi:hypothetical protein